MVFKSSQQNIRIHSSVDQNKERKKQEEDFLITVVTASYFKTSSDHTAYSTHYIDAV